MTKKQKCPLCEADVVNLSRHLVLRHNIRDIDHLKSEKLIRPLTLPQPGHRDEKKPQISNPPEESNRKNILTTALKLRHEKVARTKMRHIRRMGRLIMVYSGETVILNEGIDALISCLNYPSDLVREQAITELKNIITDNRFDSEIKKKIRPFLE